MFDTYRAETPSLPPATLSFEDVLRILRSRFRLLLGTLLLVSAATAAVAFVLPDRYRSETLILVIPQRVPESFVKSTVTARIEDRLQSITHQILSRTRLERIIQDFDLYAAKRRTAAMETVVDDMRNDITVKVVKGDAFRVAYVGAAPRTVMQVTEELASLFIDENLRDREALAEGTNRFLETQLADARQRLIAHEKKLEEYRRRFAGELPSQLTSNLQFVQNIQLQIQSLFDSVSRDRDRRIFVERQLREAAGELDASAATPATVPTEDGSNRLAPGSALAQELAASRATLTAFEVRMTPAHPDVQRQRRFVRELEAKIAAEAAHTTGSAAPAVSFSVAAEARRRRVEELRIELEQLDRQLAFKEAEDVRLHAVADQYQRRVEKVPARESELAELTRDYSTLQTLYQTLLAKHEESKIAADLERRQFSDQFKVLDPPRPAERPFAPRRWVITLAGVAGGLGLGVALVAFAEYRDHTRRARTYAGHLRPGGCDLPLRKQRSHMAMAADQESQVEKCRPFFSN